MFYSLILIIPLRFGRKKGEMIVVSMSAKEVISVNNWVENVNWPP